MAKPTDILYQEASEPAKQKARQPRIDYAFERIVLGCAIGCIIDGLYMSESDYVRMYLALSRLGNEHGGAK